MGEGGSIDAAVTAISEASKSRGQLALERQLEQFKRGIRVLERLGRVRDQISRRPIPPAGTLPAAPTTGGAKTSFFEALDGIGDGNDGLLGELERAVGEIEELF